MPTPDPDFIPTPCEECGTVRLPPLLHTIQTYRGRRRVCSSCVSSFLVRDLIAHCKTCDAYYAADCMKPNHGKGNMLEICPVCGNAIAHTPDDR